jgi:hypothetical protein
MSLEIETLDQLGGHGVEPLKIIRKVYPSDEHFLRGIYGLLKGGDVLLLKGSDEVPEWQWSELFQDGGVLKSIDGFKLKLTDQGTKRIS